jgi:hypothetical protein
MDILNIISWIKGKRQVTTIDPTKSVIPIGLKDDRRDDGYLTGVISVEDLAAQLAPAATIKTIGSTIYSANPLAGPGLNQNRSIFLGSRAGFNTINSDCSVSNFIGTDAGYNASEAYTSNFIGYRTGYSSFNAQNTNFIGNRAGADSSDAEYSNFIGGFAGNLSNTCIYSNFIGWYAGRASTNSYRSNFIGYEAGMNSSGGDVNAFGYQAHKGGTLSGQTVFSNSSLPSYLNRSAATTAITVPNGAVAGSTYLYYNQTTFAIEAVRL